jgi:hypothetical protein
MDRDERKEEFKEDDDSASIVIPSMTTPPQHQSADQRSSSSQSSHSSRTDSLGLDYGSETDDSNSNSDSNSSRVNRRKLRRRYYLKQTGRVTTDGCMVPKHVPFKMTDGTFRRPRGRRPEGMDWDYVRYVVKQCTVYCCDIQYPIRADCVFEYGTVQHFIYVRSWTHKHLLFLLLIRCSITIVLLLLL